MKNKWHDFKSSHSPLEIDNPDKGTTDLAEDWKRRGNQKQGETQVTTPTTINGFPIAHYKPSYNNFKNDKDVERFFYQVILKDSKLTTQEKKDACDYLKTVFHQGGLLNPVTSAITVSAVESAGIMPDSNAMVSEVNIVSTASGFKVQEIYTLKEALVIDSMDKDYADLPEVDTVKRLTPSEGKQFLLKAQGVIAVDFSNGKSKNPDLIVESNSIDYGHLALKQRMDTRTLGQRIVDFFKYHFGFNKVQDISAKQHQEERLATNLVTRLMR